MKPVIATLAGAAMLTFAGAAMAEEPTRLSDAQLDDVTAGLASTIVTGTTFTFGDFDADSATSLTAFAEDGVLTFGVVLTGGIGQSLLSGAVSASSATSASVFD
jgi:hypothetical protein